MEWISPIDRMIQLEKITINEDKWDGELNFEITFPFGDQ